MGDVTVGYGEKAAETAQKLLDAAEGLDLDAGVVRTTTDRSGGFLVPEEVADKAGVSYEKDDSDDEEESEDPVADKVDALGEGVESAAKGESAGEPADKDGSEDGEELKGAALDEALEKAGLPKSGTADEKRARLAEHNDSGE